ncbi:alpha-hydroxy-acid oxidizing protein [Pseudochelatococcus sp. G4_1912]|uniref:alpha-hydroxy acid oxidase n=1 Tax=Pseudochelatococcus sp. G4_1912 TaxID=3114288 RepID=UPI0039C5AD6A
MKAHTIGDLRNLAKRRIPRVIFDFLDGGAGNEYGLRHNTEALDKVRLRPRALVNTEEISLETDFLGKRWQAPFGIAPIGLTNLIWPGGDEIVAITAAENGIPYTLSTAGTTSIERIGAVAPGSWFQLYVAKSEEIVDDLVRRADVAGFDALVVTVDVPRPSRRLRDLQNGFQLPLKPSLPLMADIASRPLWGIETLRKGVPRFATIEQYAPPKSSVQSLAAYMSSQSSGRLNWEVVEKLRQQWPRKLILKGVQSAEDAARAVALGIDAIVISNHGGRQLEGAMATIESLPEIRRAVGPDYPVIFDSGIRSGEHVAKAIAYGASFVLIGRAAMYGLAAGGKAGVEQVISLMREELTITMAHLGVTAIDQLSSEHIFIPI